ncbi:MAG: radical SAM protein [Candidatus Pacebacteria bacterium]|nr:radical SAM protein [Candidatus Paceibacterota bacterium]
MYLSKRILEIGLDKEYSLLISGLSGRVNLAKTTWWKKIKEQINWKKPLTERDEGALKENGYLFTSLKEEEKEYKKISRTGKQQISKDKRLMVVVNFSEGCNLACPYCVNRHQRNQKIMSLKHLAGIFKIIDKFKKEGRQVKLISLFGGEPLRQETKFLFKEFLPEAKKREMKIKVFTNGVEIREFAGLLKKYRSLFLPMQITVDGPARIHDQRRIGPKYPKTFKIIMDNIDWLIKNEIPVSLRTNVERINFSYLPVLAREIIQRGWSESKNFSAYLGLVCADEPCYSKTNPKSRVVSFVKKYRQLLKKNPEMKLFSEESLYSFPEKFMMSALTGKKNYPKVGFCKSCGAGSYTFAADRKVYACMGSVGLKDFCLGRYYPKLIWDPKNLEKWQKRYSVNLKKCQDCPLVFICGGECPLAAFKQTGNIYEPYCREAIKNFVEFVKISRKEIISLKQACSRKKRELVKSAPGII